MHRLPLPEQLHEQSRPVLGALLGFDERGEERPAEAVLARHRAHDLADPPARALGGPLGRGRRASEGAEVGRRLRREHLSDLEPAERLPLPAVPEPAVAGLVPDGERIARGLLPDERGENARVEPVPLRGR